MTDNHTGGEEPWFWCLDAHLSTQEMETIVSINSILLFLVIISALGYSMLLVTLKMRGLFQRPIRSLAWIVLLGWAALLFQIGTLVSKIVISSAGESDTSYIVYNFTAALQDILFSFQLLLTALNWMDVGARINRFQMRRKSTWQFIRAYKGYIAIIVLWTVAILFLNIVSRVNSNQSLAEFFDLVTEALDMLLDVLLIVFLMIGTHRILRTVKTSMVKVEQSTKGSGNGTYQTVIRRTRNLSRTLCASLIVKILASLAFVIGKYQNISTDNCPILLGIAADTVDSFLNWTCVTLIGLYFRRQPRLRAMTTLPSTQPVQIGTEGPVAETDSDSGSCLQQFQGCCDFI